jgi:hypothetical protein
MRTAAGQNDDRVASEHGVGDTKLLAVAGCVVRSGTRNARTAPVVRVQEMPDRRCLNPGSLFHGLI